jgi:hypothetical protein
MVYESLDELLASLFKDKINVVFHFLVDILDGVRLKLVQFGELSEAPLDDEV